MKDGIDALALARNILHDQHDASDVVNDAYLKLWSTSRPACRSPGPLAGKVTRREEQELDIVRSRKRRPRYPCQPRSCRTGEAPQPKRYNLLDKGYALAGAVRALSAQSRMCFRPRLFDVLDDLDNQLKLLAVRCIMPWRRCEITEHQPRITGHREAALSRPPIEKRNAMQRRRENPDLS